MHLIVICIHFLTKLGSPTANWEFTESMWEIYLEIYCVRTSAQALCARQWYVHRLNDANQVDRMQYT